MAHLLEQVPPTMRPVIDNLRSAAEGDLRIIGLMAGGSAAAGIMDEFSDLDIVVVCDADSHADVLRDAPAFAARLGSLIAAFTGEHVGEPRLLITLIGSPPVKVDLKFVTAAQLDDRVEDGVIIWQRGAVLDIALARGEAVWPMPDPQWLEDRFWVWVHYATAKVGRGELFDCLNMLSFARQTVLGPLIARQRGHRPSGVRRLEMIAPDLVPALEATVGAHDRVACLRALRATVDLYRQVRDAQEAITRTQAEAEAVAYLEVIERRFG